MRIINHYTYVSLRLFSSVRRLTKFDKIVNDVMRPILLSHIIRGREKASAIGVLFWEGYSLLH